MGADIVYLTGPEPDFRWPTFIEAVVEMAAALAVRMVVGPRCLSRPHAPYPPGAPGLDGPAQSAELAGRVGTVRGTLEVPAGVQAALEVALGEAGVPVIGLWARVPHYVSAMPYPEASAALIDGLCAVTGLVLDSTSLRQAGEESRRQVDELIGANPDHLEMVRRLESALDSEEPDAAGCSTWSCRPATRSPPSSSSSSEAKGAESSQRQGSTDRSATGAGGRRSRPGSRRRRPRAPGARPARATGSSGPRHGLLLRHGRCPVACRDGPSALKVPNRRRRAGRSRWPPSPRWWWPRRGHGGAPRSRRSSAVPARLPCPTALRTGCGRHR